MNDNMNPNVDPNTNPNDPNYANTPNDPNNPNAVNDPNMPQQSQQAPYQGMPNESEPAPNPDNTQNPPYTGMPNEVNVPVGGIATNTPGAAIFPGALEDTKGATTGPQQNGDTDPIRDQPILDSYGQPLNDQPSAASSYTDPGAGSGSGMGSSAFSTSNTGYNADPNANNANYDPNDPNNPNNQAPVTNTDLNQRDPSLQAQPNPTGAPDYSQAAPQTMPDSGMGGMGGVAGGSNTPASAPGNTSDTGVVGASNIPNMIDATGDTSNTGLAGAPSQTDIGTNTNTAGVAGSSNMPNTPGAGYTGVAGTSGTVNTSDTGLAGSPTQTGDYYGQSMDQTQRPANDPGAVYGQMGTSGQPMTTDPNNPNQMNQPTQPMQAGPMGPNDAVDVNGNPLPQGQGTNLPDRQAGATGGMGQTGSGLDNEPLTGSPDHPRSDNQMLGDNNPGTP